MFVVVLAGLALAVATFIFVSDGPGRFTALVTIFVGILALIPWAASSDPQLPALEVAYRNPDRDGRAVLDRGASNLQVVVINNGRGTAEAVEVRFGAEGAAVWNESGNGPDPDVLNVAVHPPRFLGRDRVLNPGEEWPIALLAWYHGRPSGSFVWEARAKGMKLRSGTVDVDVTPW